MRKQAFYASLVAVLVELFVLGPVLLTSALNVRSSSSCSSLASNKTTRKYTGTTNGSSDLSIGGGHGVDIILHRGRHRSLTTLNMAPKKSSSLAGLPFWNRKGIPLWDHKVPQMILSKLSALATIILHEFQNLTHIQKTLLTFAFLLGFVLGRTNPFWKRLTNVMDIPTQYFGPDAPQLKGRVVSVTDGDTIRFYHLPTWFHPSRIKGRKISDKALPIRLCTIDTPETAKFGKPGQPYGEEAKAKLKELINDDIVHIRLLHKDQYGRAVAVVQKGRGFLRKFMDEEMLKVGLAEVYDGSNAVYGPRGKDVYIEMEKEAKRQRLGIWSQKHRESAAEFKKRTK